MYMRRNFWSCSYINIVYILILLILLVYLSFYNVRRELILQQVVILSRHNVRTPLSTNLNKITPLIWPKWKEEPGHLTTKGFLLESLLGAYFSDYLRYYKLVSNECPSDKEVFVHASSTERTISSAKAFIEKAFPNCNITIYHTKINESDPIFSPFIHNSSATFKRIAISEMKQTLKQLQLNNSYEEMERILIYEKSELCKLEHQCDLTKDKNGVNIIVDSKPKVSGPLKICNTALDAFLMAYYNGFSDRNVAWGNLRTLSQWDNILPIHMGYHDVTFNTSHVAKDIAHPLVKYMINMFLSEKKVVLLMGHDANINVILNSLNVKPFVLKNSFTQTPVGGKLVFQKWYDVSKNVYLFKLNFIYQSTDQLRNGEILSLKYPPQTQSLQINKCVVDNYGFCLWDDFLAFLRSL